jgi:hypothetical protein
VVDAEEAVLVADVAAAFGTTSTLG